MKFIYILTALILSTVSVSMAQQGFGTSTPDKSSVIDMTAGNKGALLPRVQLTGTTDAATIVNAANALTVFNTATVADVTPGYYYWSLTSNKWIRLLDQTNSTAGWGLTGNAGTVEGTNFIGTTDFKSFNIRVNNVVSGSINVTNENTSFGQGTLQNNTTGDRNTVMGSGSLLYNTTGRLNSGFGDYSLGSNTTGIFNTAVGGISLSGNTTGNYNIGIGVSALTNNKSSNNNIGIGYNTLVSQGFDTGGAPWDADNIAIGFKALNSTNSTSTTNGIQNTAIGSLAGYSNSTGSANTYLGYNAAGSAMISNATAIGANAVVGASNSLVLGGIGANAVSVGIGVNAPTSTLQVNGSFATNINSVSNTYTVSDQDHTIIFENQTAAFTVTLPNPAACKGRILIFANYGINATPANNYVTLSTPFGVIRTRQSGGVVTNSSTFELRNGGNTQGSGVSGFQYIWKITLQSNGANWYTVGNEP